jgi:hypothetical protein
MGNEAAKHYKNYRPAVLAYRFRFLIFAFAQLWTKLTILRRQSTSVLTMAFGSVALKSVQTFLYVLTFCCGAVILGNLNAEIGRDA